MDQILHIFKKDIRRHWPEILVSLALLGLYTRYKIHPWSREMGSLGSSPWLFLMSGRVVIPALILSWLFLGLRVIQSESLVGDRQWWVTKPYVWWKLFIAKLLFLFVFICVPLYHSQLFLLHKAGFPVLQYLWSVVLLQISIPGAILLFVILLACLTRNLGQALLTLAIALAVVIAIAWVASQVPGESMHRYSELSQNISNFLIFGPLFVAPLWQFARRKTWRSRALVCAAFPLSALFGILLPNGGDIEKFYPLVSQKNSPVQISLRPFEERHNPFGGLSRWDDSVNLEVPISVSGVAPGTLILVDGINVIADSPDSSRWNRGWNGQFQRIWPEDQRKKLEYPLDRKTYDKYKSNSYNLRIEIALSEYQAVDARTIRVPSETFTDATLGTCRLPRFYETSIQCLKPIQAPGFMARFDGAKSPCTSFKNSNIDRNLLIEYAWESPHIDYLPDSSLDSVINYDLWFGPIERNLESESSAPQEFSTRICSGDDFWIARPVFKRQFRVRLELSNTRLFDLAGAD